MSDKDKRHFETNAVHSGRVDVDGARSVTTPIYATSTYREEYPGDESGFVYSRWANPTRAALETALAKAEHGSSAHAFASGLAAVGAVINLLSAGDHVVAVDDLYGGCHRLFERLLRPNFKLDFSYVDGRDPSNFKKAIKDNTKLFWVETPTNPLLKLVDIDAVAKIAHERGILLAVDNTFATPYLQNPLDHGADIVHHSLSKYLGGHCDIIGGAIITNNDALGEKIFFNQYAVGGVLDPFQSWLVLRGLKTLHVRMDRHAHNAKKIAEYLQTVDKVSRVYFPGLDGKPLPNGMKLPGGMVSFEIDAGFETVKKFVMALRTFVLAESLGGVESLVNHPSTMTHASIPKDIREAHGITDQLIRLSVGIEHEADLLSDLKQAFAVI